MLSNLEELLLNGFPTQVQLWTDADPHSCPWFIWKLIPVEVEGLLTPSKPSREALVSDFLPSYDWNAPGQSSTHAQRVESEREEFGTIVNEVTIVTTRKRYRVEDA